MRTGDTIEEPRVVITCRARLTGPHACTRVHSSSRSLSGACLSPFHPLHSITLPPFALPPYYSPLSTCKRRISTRSATDPRSHLLPRQLMDSGLLHSRYHLSKDSTILPGYNAVVDTTTVSGRERGERVWFMDAYGTRVDGDNGRILVRFAVYREDKGVG